MWLKRNWYKLLLALLVILGIGVYIIAIHIFPYVILQPNRRTVKEIPNAAQYQKVNLLSHDSLDLAAYYHPVDSARATIITLHGRGNNKESFLNTSKWLAERGIASLLLDQRAHGQSEGEYSTYGYHEKRDVAAAVSWLETQQDPELPIGVWGVSLGGAIGIQALDHDDRLDFGIIISTFTDMRTIIKDYGRRDYPFLPIWIADLALNQAGEIAHFSPDEVCPLESAKRCSQPIFIAHGDADEAIKFQYGQSLYENWGGQEKTFYPVSNGKHQGLWNTGGEAYQEAIDNFLEEL